MYQFSLKAFSVVFDVAIKVGGAPINCLSRKITTQSPQRAVMDSNVAHRVRNLTDSITFQVFQYTTRWRFLNRGCFKKKPSTSQGSV